MEEFESPTYVLDLANSLNCAHIESAKPGVPVEVRVVPEAGGESILAKGLLNSESTSFSVEVVTPAGTQTHSWTWEFLKDALEYRRNSR